MRVLPFIGLLGLSSLCSASQIRRPRDYENNDYYVLEFDSTTTPAQVATRLSLDYEGKLGELPDHHIFSTRKSNIDVVKPALKQRRQLLKRGLDIPDTLDSVRFAQKQKLKPKLEKRELRKWPARPKRQAPGGDKDALVRQQKVADDLLIKDPIFKDQWHLFNPVELGHDVNVSDVWRQGITGHNATVAIVDDGLDMYSDDLKDNYYAEGSYDFNDHDVEPKPELDDDRHGTRCAGEVSAVKNDVCGVGVAWNSKIAGIRILSKMISDADEAVAMNYAYQHNQIYSCSWGPPDDGRSMDAPGILIKRAMLNSVQNGRGGLGSIYVFASGNGASNDDNCNFDGYTNSIYSITVGAIDRKGLHPYYSEKCSAQLVVTYSSGSGDAIHTTDVGTNKCYDGHGGTSAAAPLAAGIFALVLSIRPDLTWRDMQYLVMQTALPVDLETTEWQDTSIGLKYSHTFGYGKIDTWATIEAAKTFKNVKPQAWYFSPWVHVNQDIPQGDKGIAVTYDVTADMLKDANVERLEHVTVTMNVDHTRRGDLSVELISPDNVKSYLSATRRLDSSTQGYADWTFMSVVHWGEKGVGQWTVIVKDTIDNEYTGKFVDFHLKLWGEATDASKAKLLPMPTDHDDDNHDQTELIGTTTIAASTTSVSTQPLPTITANPTDHPDRPINSKPSDTTGDEVAKPTSTGADGQEPSTGFEENVGGSGWLPSFFPTFGVSSKTQVWIYGSLVLIVAFCSGLGLYFYLARRKRLLNNPRDDYEFELLNEEESQGLTKDGKGVVKGASAMKGKRRAGELYDAFAAGSEEDDLTDDDDEDGRDGYRDRRDESHVIGNPDDFEDLDSEGETDEKGRRVVK